MSSPEFNPDIKDALNVVGNHEPKLGGYIGVHKQGELSHSDINSILCKHYGLPVVNLAGNFEHVFARHGFSEMTMEPSRHTSQIVRIFSTARAESALPVIGEMYESTSNTTLALSTLLGRTNSNSQVGLHAPFTSYNILRAALEGRSSAFDEQSIRDILRRADTLVEHGILTPDEDVNRFSIVNPTYEGSRSFDHLSPASQIVYSALQVAKESAPTHLWNIKELMTLAEGLFEEVSEESLSQKVYEALVRAASQAQRRGFKGAINKIKFRYGHYKVTPTYVDTIADLVERVTKLGEARDTFLAKATEKAMGMYDAGVDAGKIIMKGVGKFGSGRSY